MTKDTGGPARPAPAFAATTSLAAGNAARSVPATAMIAKIDARGVTLKERAIEHYKRFEPRWVAAESFRIWERHMAENAKYPAPKNAKPVTPLSLLKMASHNVQARTNRRLSNINAITTRMGNAVVRNLAPPDLKRTFNEAAPAVRLIDNPKMRR